MDTLIEPLSAVFIVGFLAGVILALVFVFKKGNRKANRIFAAFLIASLISFLYTVLLPAKLYVYLPHLILIRYPAMFLIGPLFFLYIKALIRDGGFRGPWESLHFLPAFLCLLLMTPFYLKDAEYKIRYIETAVQRPETGVIFLFFLAYVQVMVYFLWANRLIRGYVARSKQAYSGPEPVHLDWIRNLSGIVLVIYLFCLALFGLVFLGQDAERVIDYSFLIALLLYFSVLFVGYRVWIQPDLGSSPGPPEKKEKYLKSKLSREESRNYFARLIELMEKEKAFLEPGLNLSDLSKRMDLNPRYLSRIINENARMNFYDFVNRFRVEAAKQAISDPQNAHRDILTIAFDAGFSSKATFNTLFKRYTSLTPSQYRKAK